MATKAQLLLLARARKRKAEAEGTATPMPAGHADAPEAFAAASADSQKLQGGPGVEPEQNLIDYVLGRFAVTGDVAKQGLHGVATGIENMIAAPGDIADLMGMPEGTPLIGQLPDREDMRNFSTLGGVLPEREDPEGWLEQLTRRIGEEIGASAVPVGGIAAKATQLGTKAVREAGGLTRYLLEPAAVDLPGYLGKEATMAAAAGTGAGAANIAMGGDRSSVAGQAADFGGALAGATLTSAGGAIGSRLMDLIAAASGNPKFASKVVRQNAADTIISNSDNLGAQVDPARPHDPVDTTDLVEQIMRPSMAEDVIPGFRPSTADRAGDSGLASLENARSKGPNSGRFRARQDDNTRAVDSRLGELAPTEEPGAFSTALADQRDAELLAAIQNRTEVESAAERLAAPLRPASTPAARGNVVRTGLEDARDTARGATEDAYAAADIADVQVDPTDLAGTIDSATANLTEVERGLIPEGVLARVRALGEPGAPTDTGLLDAKGKPVMGEPEPPGPVQMKEATDLLSELKRLQRAALADPRAEKGGRNAARVLGQVIDAVDGFIFRNLDETQAEALNTARSTKFDEAENFTRAGDPVAAALARHEGGQPRMRDERVAGTFVNPQAMDRLFAQADTPQVRTAIKEELLSRGDTTTAEHIDDFIATYGEQLNRFPGLREQLATVADARRTQATVTEAERATQRRLGTPDGSVPGRGPVADYLRHEPAQAEKAMRNVINADRPGEAADELLSFAKDEPRAVQGARRAFWNVMERDNRSKNGAIETPDGVEPWLPKKWRTFLDRPNVRAVMDRLYRGDEEHLRQIREIAEALRTVNVGNKAGAAINPSGSAQQLRNGPITLAEAQAKFIDVNRGRLNPLYAVTYLAGKVANRLVSKAAEKAYQRLLDEALLNPEVAAQLLKDNNPANRAALARSAKGWIGAEAANLTEMLGSDDEEPDEVIRAATKRDKPKTPSDD